MSIVEAMDTKSLAGLKRVGQSEIDGPAHAKRARRIENKDGPASRTGAESSPDPLPETRLKGQEPLIAQRLPPELRDKVYSFLPGEEARGWYYCDGLPEKTSEPLDQVSQASARRAFRTLIELQGPLALRAYSLADFPGLAPAFGRYLADHHDALAHVDFHQVSKAVLHPLLCAVIKDDKAAFRAAALHTNDMVTAEGRLEVIQVARGVLEAGDDLDELGDDTALDCRKAMVTLNPDLLLSLERPGFELVRAAVESPGAGGRLLKHAWPILRSGNSAQTRSLLQAAFRHLADDPDQRRAKTRMHEWAAGWGCGGGTTARNLAAARDQYQWLRRQSQHFLKPDSGSEGPHLARLRAALSFDEPPDDIALVSHNPGLVDPDDVTTPSALREAAAKAAQRLAEGGFACKEFEWLLWSKPGVLLKTANWPVDPAFLGRLDAGHLEPGDFGHLCRYLRRHSNDLTHVPLMTSGPATDSKADGLALQPLPDSRLVPMVGAAVRGVSPRDARGLIRFLHHAACDPKDEAELVQRFRQLAHALGRVRHFSRHVAAIPSGLPLESAAYRSFLMLRPGHRVRTCSQWLTSLQPDVLTSLSLEFLVDAGEDRERLRNHVGQMPGVLKYIQTPRPGRRVSNSSGLERPATLDVYRELLTAAVTALLKDRKGDAGEILRDWALDCAAGSGDQVMDHMKELPQERLLAMAGCLKDLPALPSGLRDPMAWLPPARDWDVEMAAHNPLIYLRRSDRSVTWTAPYTEALNQVAHQPWVLAAFEFEPRYLQVLGDALMHSPGAADLWRFVQPGGQLAHFLSQATHPNILRTAIAAARRAGHVVEFPADAILQGHEQPEEPPGASDSE